MARLLCNKTQTPGGRHIRRRPVRALQISESRPTTGADRVPLAAAILAIAGKQIEQIL